MKGIPIEFSSDNDSRDLLAISIIASVLAISTLIASVFKARQRRANKKLVGISWNQPNWYAEHKSTRFHSCGLNKSFVSAMCFLRRSPLECSKKYSRQITMVRKIPI